MCSTYQRAKPVITDPGLYSLKKSDVFWVSQKGAYLQLTSSSRFSLDDAFKTLYRILFMGWDNFPRIVLMYYANFLSSPKGYFHNVICNAEEFKNTTVNHDLHFIYNGGIEKIAWDATGERLVVAYKDGNELYKGLIATYDVKRATIITSSLIGFIRGPGEDPKPLTFSFHDKYKQDPLLSVRDGIGNVWMQVWITGSCVTYPLLIRLHLLA
ncbi:hypothetical protein LXL04_036592 [Taraxacum kok-saghyz]